MDDETFRLLVVALVSSLVAHSLRRRYLVACVIAAGICPLTYAIAEAVRHPDLIAPILGWFPVIFGVGFTCGFGVAVIVGLPFLLWRKVAARTKRQQEQNP